MYLNHIEHKLYNPQAEMGLKPKHIFHLDKLGYSGTPKLLCVHFTSMSMLTLHSFEMPNTSPSVLMRDGCSLGRRGKKSRQIRQISLLMWISNLHRHLFHFISDQLSPYSRTSSPIYLVSPEYVYSVSEYVFLHFSVNKKRFPNVV